MKTLKIKQTIAAIWLAFALIVGSGWAATHLGVEAVPSVYASECGLGAGSGGGC